MARHWLAGGFEAVSPMAIDRGRPVRLDGPGAQRGPGRARRQPPPYRESEDGAPQGYQLYGPRSAEPHGRRGDRPNKGSGGRCSGPSARKPLHAQVVRRDAYRSVAFMFVGLSARRVARRHSEAERLQADVARSWRKHDATRRSGDPDNAGEAVRGSPHDYKSQLITLAAARAGYAVLTDSVPPSEIKGGRRFSRFDSPPAA